MLVNLARGLTTLGNGQALAYLFGGSLIGVCFGVIPGLGGVVVLSVILAFIYHVSLTGAVCLFLAVQAGSYFSASMTSILLNTPAHPEAFAVTFDGFPMAQRGEAGRALGISASATCIGGLIGCAALVGFIQVIDYIPSIFHPPEYVGLVCIALILVGTLGTDAASKALISGGIGLMIATIGADPITGVIRYTFGSVALYDGISLVALALGLFAIPQMVLVFGTATAVAHQDMLGNRVDSAVPVQLQRGLTRQVIGGVLETLHHWGALTRAALIGVVTGIVPGIGGFAANFLSYGVAQQMSRTPARFGTGIPEGIIAPEGSSLSKEAGGMVPIIGLGIPGGVGGALFLAALLIKGVKTGYGFAATYPVLPYEMVWVIALGGLIGTSAGLLAAPVLARVTRVPGPLLVPIIMGLSVIGPFVSDVSFFSVMEVLAFSVVGLVLRRLRYSLASFAIGLVLGPTFEVNLFQTHYIFPGWTFLKRPLADALFVIVLAILVLKTVQVRRAARAVYASVEEDDPTLRAAEIRRLELARHPYPVLSLITTVGIVGLCLAFSLYGATQYGFDSALLPVAASGLAGGVALWRVPFEIAALRSHLQSRRLVASGLSPQPREALLAEERSLEPALEMAGAALVGGPPGDLGVLPLQHGELHTGSSTGLPSAPFAIAPVRHDAWGRHGQYTRELAALCWFGVLVAGCYLFSFNVAIPAFVLLYGLSATRRVWRGWPGRAIFAATAAVAMWAVSYELQNILHLTFSPVIKF